MKIVRLAFQTLNDAVYLRSSRNFASRALSTNAVPDPLETEDESVRRIFGGHTFGDRSSDSFFHRLDRIKMGARDRMDGLDDGFDTLSDGMDGKLKKAAAYFEIDEEEVEKDDYAFRPDVRFWPQTTYDTKDLDLTKPAVPRTSRRNEFETTTEEVLKKADFRNVRFLANFITEAGIIIKRSKTGISAKAQRKIAREIKTARAFGLMPFTTMGTKSFVFGKTMEGKDEDFEYETFDRLGADADGVDPL